MLNSIFIMTMQSFNDDQLRQHKKHLEEIIQTNQKKIDLINQLLNEKQSSKQLKLI